VKITVHTPIEYEVLGTDLGFTEGPVVAHDGTVYVVDISEGRIWRLADGDATVAACVQGGPNGMALESPTTAIVANNGGFPWTEIDGVRYPIDVVKSTNEPDGFSHGWLERVDLVTGAVTRFVEHGEDRALRGPNDLVLDDAGGIWFTDTGKFRRESVDHGTLYYGGPGGAPVTAKAAPFLGANGVGLSPDGSRLYLSETLTGRLWAWELAGPGELVPNAAGAAFHGGTCIAATPFTFDSLAVEADGRIAVAAIGDGVVVLTPDGAEVDVHPVPNDVTTNLAFGGTDGRRAVLTLARTGRVVETSWPRPGLVAG
jgi:gluconolactonase